MAKTLKDFLEGYLKVKSADEQKFIDKHVTVKNPDRNGNGDDVFKGSTKAIDRRKERKGYNPGEDEKVYEELKGNQHKIDANKNGKLDAHDFKLLRKKKKVAEEAEQIDEILDTPEKVADYKAKAEKSFKKNIWKGGEKAHRTTTKRLYGLSHPKVANEEAEQIDELSKKTLGSYVKKASGAEQPKNVMSPKNVPLTKIAAYQGDSETGHFGKRFNQATYDKAERLRKNRQTGITRAADKLAKEEVELEEKLTAKTPMGTYIKDFQKSDAPQFKGKSQEKRRAMAIAAKLTAERGGKPLRKEERLQNNLTDISESHQRIMLEVFEKLNEDNKSKFMEACTTPEGVEQMLDFAIRHRGE